MKRWQLANRPGQVTAAKKKLARGTEKEQKIEENRMKIPSATGLLQIVCISATIASGTMCAGANPIIPPTIITNVDFPSIGTPEKLTAFAVHTVNRIFVWSWVYETNGQMRAFYGPTWYGNVGTSAYIYGPLTNKVDMDRVCVDGINMVLSHLITNNDPSIDKSKGLYMSIDCQAYSGICPLDVFYWSNNHVYLAISNGNYILPDMSSLSTQLNSYIPLYLPGLQWARYEIGNVGNDYPFEVDDNLYEPPGPIDSDGFLDLPTGYMTNSSTTNGVYWMKISAFAKGQFWIWNGDGTQVSETPFTLKFSGNGANATVTASGGDSGRGFVLQSSADLSAWTNCSQIVFVPTNAPPNLVPTVFSYPFTNGTIFFRTATTNVPPM